jgi:hypothetical protein
MKKNVSSGLLLTIIIILLSGSVYAVDSIRTLTSSHFIINYNISESNPAIKLSSDLESMYDTISRFLEIDPLEKIHLKITKDLTSITPADEFNQNYEFISIYPEGDYNRIKSELYDRLFTVFLRKLIQTQNITSVIPENFIQALRRYPVMNRQLQNVMLNDLVNIEGLTSISLNQISTLNTTQQQLVYSAFIDFIISSYGKKILIQSLKDAVYYNGFFNSITMITGDSAGTIETGFNSWLLQYKSGSRLETDDRMKLIHLKDECENSSYSISDDGQIALLQIKDNQYRIFLKNKTSEEIIYLKKTGIQSSFNELIFVSKSRLAVVEILLNGSKILIYDIPGKKIVKQIPLSQLFIDEIQYSEKNKFIFSAWCGSHSDIYTFDIETDQFNIITESGNNYYPLILNNKAYYVSVSDKNNIRELDLSSGEIKSIFSSERKISDLNKVNNHTFTFFMNLNGADTLYIMDTQSGNLNRINTASPSISKPQITGRHIYFFSFFKGRYRLFTYEYNI